jgi:hypothetical protein
MIDPTPNERNAMANGGVMAGEYLDSLSKTDLAQLSVESGTRSSKSSSPAIATICAISPATTATVCTTWRTLMPPF